MSEYCKHCAETDEKLQAAEKRIKELEEENMPKSKDCTVNPDSLFCWDSETFSSASYDGMTSIKVFRGQTSSNDDNQSETLERARRALGNLPKMSLLETHRQLTERNNSKPSPDPWLGVWREKGAKERQLKVIKEIYDEQVRVKLPNGERGTLYKIWLQENFEKVEGE